MLKAPQPGVIKDLLAEAGLGQVKQNSKSYILNCPRCKKKDKLYIRKADGRFCCWRCKELDNFQGAPEYVFAELLNRPIQELRKLIWGLDGPTGNLFLTLNLTDWFGDDDEIDVLAMAPPVGVEPDPGFRSIDSQWGEPGLAYLESRGIPLSVALDYGIEYWPAEQRVVFPVKSQGKLLGWQSRIIGPTEFETEDGRIATVPKALTYNGLKKDRVLMFGDRITGTHCVLTEGPVDAIKADRCGGNVASLGKAVSFHQLALLKNSGITRLYVGLDPDAAPEIKRIVDELYSDLEIYDMRAPTSDRDLGAMSFDEVYDLYRNAPRVNKGTLFVYIKRHW
jgi:hypothetical protein